MEKEEEKDIRFHTALTIFLIYYTLWAAYELIVSCFRNQWLLTLFAGVAVAIGVGELYYLHSLRKKDL